MRVGTVKGLLQFFENFYGEKYSGVFLAVMQGYLDGKSEAYLKAAASVIVKHFSRTWGKAPGPAEFEKYKNEILEAIPGPKALEEPVKSPASSEEKAAFFRKLRETFEGKSGPLAGRLVKTFEALEVNNEGTNYD